VLSSIIDRLVKAEAEVARLHAVLEAKSRMSCACRQDETAAAEQRAAERSTAEPTCNVKAHNVRCIDLNDGSVVAIGMNECSSDHSTNAVAADACAVGANKRLTKQQRKRESAGCTDVDCPLEKVAPEHVLEATMAEGEAQMTPTQVQARLHEKGYCVHYAYVDNAFARRRRREKAAKRQAAAMCVVEPQGTPDDGAHISLAATAAAVSE